MRAVEATLAAPLERVLELDVFRATRAMEDRSAHIRSLCVSDLTSLSPTL